MPFSHLHAQQREDMREELAPLFFDAICGLEVMLESIPPDTPLPASAIYAWVSLLRRTGEAAGAGERTARRIANDG